MGDLIEGPSDSTRIVYGSATPHSSASRSSEGISSWQVFWGFTLLSIGLMAAAIWDQSVEGERFALEMSGKCFATAVGARGMVESSDGRTKSVKMIFPSGLRENYSVEGLEEIPCGLLTEGDNSKGAIR